MCREASGEQGSRFFLTTILNDTTPHRFGLFPTLISAIHTTSADSKEDFSQEGLPPVQASINSVALTVESPEQTPSESCCLLALLRKLVYC